MLEHARPARLEDGPGWHVVSVRALLRAGVDLERVAAWVAAKGGNRRRADRPRSGGSMPGHRVARDEFLVPTEALMPGRDGRDDPSDHR